MVAAAPSPFATHWDLDPQITFLNHGSFGACPRVVLQHQRQLQQELEAEPVRFLHRELEARLDPARAALAAVVGCDADDLAFVTNATSGVNTVLRSLTFAPGDELLVTDHEYNACRNVVDHVAARSGAQVRVAVVPFPLQDPQQVIDAVLAAVTPRTRLLLIDHVTSPTGMVMPVGPIAQALAARGIDTLVDGAHAPGMLPLDLRTLGAAYYTGNCHKWLCTPKGSALLWVRRDRQGLIRPLSISHGANSPRTDRSRFRLEFDFTGTCDPTPWLVIPTALQFLGSLLPSGIPTLQQHNRQLALEGRALLCRALDSAPAVPATMIGSLASVLLPPSDAPGVGPHGLDPLQMELWDRHRIEVPVMRWAQPKLRLLRISPQIYNSLAQYELLARAVASAAAR
ncbi:MAG: aminotransferase class V-fold PLP-dependent enzyme [Planctomycetes bacterium]|nr:aminotransferase class V-fold PLP-dependent enzyme [Planctomycetota bacterium]